MKDTRTLRSTGSMRMVTVSTVRKSLNLSAKTNVEALKEFEYFTFPFIGDEKVALKDPVDDRMEYRDKLLTLYFTVPLLTPVQYEKIEDFSLAVYDPEMYVALTFNGHGTVKIVSAKPVGCTAHVGESAAEAKDSIPSQPGESSDPSGSPVKSAREERRRLARAAQARSFASPPICRPHHHRVQVLTACWCACELRVGWRSTNERPSANGRDAGRRNSDGSLFGTFPRRLGEPC